MNFRGKAGRLLLRVAAVLVLLGGGGWARGQETAPLTLHVYEDTIQIPVLVLGSDRRMMPPIEGDKFSVSLDSGPKFQPSHVRQEGDDPISLSILLNLNQSGWPQLPDLGGTLGLDSRDHVSLFALGCVLVRSLDDAPANGANLKQAVAEGFRKWQETAASPCERPVEFRDALGYVVKQLRDLPGRRVVLVVSSGEDDGGTTSWDDLRTVAQAGGTAIFGIRLGIPGASEQLFDGLCQLSGGLLAIASRDSLQKRLQDFTAMVRGRYIVEFPRPAKFSTGAHSINVTIAGEPGGYIRASGRAVPLPDPKVLADPTTVPNDPAKTPELGNRRAVSQGAQDSAKGQEQAPLTLHVYEDTIQIPVLVLNRNRQMMAPIAASKFWVSLDSGPQFRPSHVRQEGDDPISLGILLNLSGPSWPTLTDIDKAFGLVAKDHVSVYVLACGLVRLMNDVPASDERLRQIAEDGFRVWKERASSACKEPVAFRDDMAYIVNELGKVPGRRVMLAITDGQDSGSKASWNDLRMAAQESGTAIFGMRVGVGNWVAGEDQFDALCQLTGGLLAGVQGKGMNERLKDFTAMVRGRYIVEFPRPAKFTKGGVSIDVTVAGMAGAYVRSSGLGVPLQDPKVLADPTTVQGDPAKTPELGTRRALPK